ncbi:MAG: hypothetical protein Q9166_006538 [cf. Caloplaca sp. 2 TL-2023]
MNLDSRHHPVVAYEEFLVYWAQWKLADSARILEAALSQAHENGKDTESYGLYTLLRIALGKTEVFTKGDFTKARDGMREVRRWLADVTLDQYTDVQIACLSHYYFLIVAANHVTDNFDHESFRKIPLASDIKEGELNITRLRHELQEHGRLRDARSILSFEVGFLTDEQAKQEACRSLIDACSRPGKKEPVWAVESTARSMLAQSLRRAGDVVEAEKETALALDLLKQAPVSQDQNKAHLTVRLDQMKATSYSGSQESFKVWTEFSEEEAVKADQSILSTTLGKVADAALELLQAAPTLENKSIFWEWQRRNESLLQQSGDAYFLYMSKLFTGVYI